MDDKRAIKYLYPKMRFMLPSKLGDGFEAVLSVLERFWLEYADLADTVYVPLGYDVQGLRECLEEEGAWLIESVEFKVWAMPYLQGVGEVGVLRSLTIKEGRYYEEVISINSRRG